MRKWQMAVGAGIVSVSVVAVATPAINVISNILLAKAVGVADLDASSKFEFPEIPNEPHKDQPKPWKVKLETKGASDFYTTQLTIGPNGSTGWHSHPGAAIVTVNAGTASFYEASDPTCTPTDFAAGTGFVETGGDIHIARNESATNNLELTLTFIIPSGQPTKFDQPAPSTCPVL